MCFCLLCNNILPILILAHVHNGRFEGDGNPTRSQKKDRQICQGEIE